MATVTSVTIGRIQLQDDAGQPIPDVHIEGTLQVTIPGELVINGVTDANGEIPV